MKTTVEGARACGEHLIAALGAAAAGYVLSMLMRAVTSEQAAAQAGSGMVKIGAPRGREEPVGDYAEPGLMRRAMIRLARLPARCWSPRC
jgi:hypothetical protein